MRNKCFIFHYIGGYGSPRGSDGKESACNAGNSDSIPGLGRSPGGGNGKPLQYSCLENSMDRGPRQALGRPSVPAQTNQYHASNLDWWFVSYMILYMFQCHSPKSSHPLPLPQSPKDCSIYQCLFCCLVYHLVIVTIFLNSIYMR